jgi:hypothetical protein
MSVATQLIAQEQYGKDMKFELLYTSMDTPEFIDNTDFMGFVLIFIPLVFFAFISDINKIVEGGSEEHENKIWQMLKRNGMREIVDVVRQSVLFFAVSIVVLPLITLFFMFLGFGYINYLLLLTFFLLVFLNFFLFEIIMNNGLREKHMFRLLFKTVYYLIQFLLQFLVQA